LIAVVVLLACGLLGGFAWWARWLEWHNRQLELQVARADREAREARNQRRIAEERRRLSERHHYAEGLRRARQALDAHQWELAQDILHDLRPEPGADDLRGFAWQQLWRRAHREFSQLWGHSATVLNRAMSPDGRTFATRDQRGSILIWDRSPGMELDTPRVRLASLCPDSEWLAFAPDGRYLACLDRAPPKPEIVLIDPTSGRQVARLDCAPADRFGGFCFDAEGRRAAVLLGLPGAGRVVRWWEIADSRPESHDVPIESRLGPGWLSSETRLIWVNRDRGVALLDPRTGAVRVELEAVLSDPPGETVFSADGRLAATHVGNRILSWETHSGREVGRDELAGGLVRMLFSPKGARLAVMNDSGYVTVIERSSGRRQVLTSGPPRGLRGHFLSFSSDEALLAISVSTTVGGLQALEVWDVATPRRIKAFPGRQDAEYPTFFPGSRSLLVMGSTKPRIWRLDPPGEPDALAGHRAEAWCAAFSPDGKVLATGSDDTGERRTIRLWDRQCGRLRAGWKGHTATVASLAFSPDGRLLASSSLDAGGPGNANVILWNAASHRPLARLRGHTGRVRSVAFSPDGRTLATAGDDLTARLWDVAARATRSVLTGHAKNLTCVAFSPDGRTLATASNDATVRLWDAAAGRARLTLLDAGNVNAIAFARDGTLLASTNENGEIKLWRPAQGDLVLTIPGEADQLRCVTFTPDGRGIIAAGKGKVIRVWDVATGQELLTLEGHKAQVNALAFSPDGAVLVSCDHDGAVRLWRAGPTRIGPDR
jgi:WD40 repeat protein